MSREGGANLPPEGTGPGMDELQAELQEKDKLNREYLEALQAAESTIAYLTACSLDSECGIGQQEM